MQFTQHSSSWCTIRHLMQDASLSTQNKRPVAGFMHLLFNLPIFTFSILSFWKSTNDGSDASAEMNSITGVNIKFGSSDDNTSANSATTTSSSSGLTTAQYLAPMHQTQITPLAWICHPVLILLPAGPSSAQISLIAIHNLIEICTAMRYSNDISEKYQDILILSVGSTRILCTRCSDDFCYLEILWRLI